MYTVQKSIKPNKMELTKDYFDKQFKALGDKFVSKEHFDKELSKFVTKEYLDKKFDETLEPIKDGIRDIKNDILDIKETVVRIDKRDLEDSNAFKTIVLNHDKRLKIVEKALKIS